MNQNKIANFNLNLFIHFPKFIASFPVTDIHFCHFSLNFFFVAVYQVFAIKFQNIFCFAAGVNDSFLDFDFIEGFEISVCLSKLQ